MHLVKHCFNSKRNKNLGYKGVNRFFITQKGTTYICRLSYSNGARRRQTKRKKKRMKRKHLRTGYPGSVSIYSNLSCAVFTTPKSFYNLYFIYYLLFCRVFQLMKRREKISQSSRTNFLSSFEVELQTHSFHQRFLHEIRVKNSS